MPLNFRQLIFANRVGQQAVKLGKDIQTDHDIIEEELIKPSEMKTDASTAEPMVTSEDPQVAQTHDQPNLVQLVKYKQQLRTENDRRLHRRKLADLALTKRKEEDVLQSEVQTTSDDVEEQIYEQRQKLNLESNEIPMTTDEKSTKIGPMGTKSKEEEEMLDDENVFQERKQRTRMRSRRQGNLSDSNTPRLRENPDIGLNTLRRLNSKSTPIMQFSLCKKCGAIINEIHPTAQFSQREPGLSPNSIVFLIVRL